VRHLVDLHGGTVEARSAGEGRGATFVVRLPASVPPADGHVDGAAAPPVGLQAGGTVRIDGLRVLVVEDDADIRDALCLTVGQAGGVVTGVGTAYEALAAIVATRPDVVLCDIGLPLEDGYVLVRKIRALPAADGGDVPVVALTAYARADDRARALASGFQAHLAKPVDPATLVGTLLEVCSASNGTHGARRSAPSGARPLGAQRRAAP
jgi:CheY-like chemotaxis protein